MYCMILFKIIKLKATFRYTNTLNSLSKVIHLVTLVAGCNLVHGEKSTQKLLGQTRLVMSNRQVTSANLFCTYGLTLKQ